MPKQKIDAFLALRSEGRFLIGRERIRLLEAVIEHGSITKAAKAAGFSYKTAWEAVDAINNLLPSPAFITKAGGRTGGGAEVTEEGRRLIATFHKLEDRLAQISNLIAEVGLESDDEGLLWAMSTKISARNTFRAEVTQVRRWPVDVEISLKIDDQHTMLAIVTNSAASDLALAPGRKVLALLKASFIRIDRPEQVPNPVQNWFTGTIRRRVDAEVNTEIHLDIGYSKTLVAVVPRAMIENLSLHEGDAATASFDANHVILASD